MISKLFANEAVIGEHNFRQFISPVLPDGTVARHGGVPRNMKTHPIGSYPWAKAVDFPLTPQAEWAERIRDMEANGSNLSAIRMMGGPNQGMIPSRDQNGRGYCWQHSGVSAMLLNRAKMNSTYADLSAYAPSCRDKNFADEGGWGAEGVDNLVKWGVPTSEFWPQQATSSKYNTAETWANAAKYKVSDQWADIDTAQYDRSLTFAQVATLLLHRIPVVVDYNWWGHSVCAADLVNALGFVLRTESGKEMRVHNAEMWLKIMEVTGGFGIRIWNSWGETWSANGMGILDPSKAVPDGAVGERLVAA